MGIAFTNDGSIRYTKWISGSTCADLLAAIDAQLIGSGWQRALGAFGYLYTATSPQIFPGPRYLKMTLYVYDDGNYIRGGVNLGPHIKLQLQGAAGAPLGKVHRLSAAEGLVYWLWSDSCQFFAATTGVFVGPGFHAFHCGIPRLRFGSTLEQCWWSAASGDEVGGACFRNGAWTYDRYSPGEFSVCVDNFVYSSDSFADALNYRPYNWLALLPLAIPSDILQNLARPRIREYPGGEDDWIAVNPLVGWGSDPKSTSLTCFGQLWDSFLISDYRDTIDEELNLLGGNLPIVVYGHSEPKVAINDPLHYTANRGWGSTLALVRGEVTTPGLRNYVY